jgi:hypothetical protein
MRNSPEKKKTKRFFFFEKKKQKTFIHLRALPAWRAPIGKSFFGSFFSKKEHFLTLP